MSSNDDEDAFEAFLSTFLTIFFLFLAISLFCACRRCCCSRRRPGIVLSTGNRTPSTIINITRNRPIITSGPSPPPPPLLNPYPNVMASPMMQQPGYPTQNPSVYPGQYGSTTTTTYYPTPGSVPPAQGPPPATFFPPPPPYEPMLTNSGQHQQPFQPSFNPEFTAPPGYSEKQ